VTAVGAHGISEIRGAISSTTSSGTVNRLVANSPPDDCPSLAKLDAAQRLQPDVVVVDLNLPHVHGLEVCRQIKQDNPDARSRRVSAMNDSDVKLRSIGVAASAFVCKGRATCSRPSNAW
jgi:CheY-like chemotaxis protein